MELKHYSREPLTQVYSVKQEGFYMKPRGLWVSDDRHYGWRQWCLDEGFDYARLRYQQSVYIDPESILVMTNGWELDDFTQRYGCGEAHVPNYQINWTAVAAKYKGILITPYLWEKRLSQDTPWYYPWDCASGCIWDSTAVTKIGSSTETNIAKEQ